MWPNGQNTCVMLRSVNMTEIVKFPKAPIAYEGWIIIGVAVLISVALFWLYRISESRAALFFSVLGAVFSLFSLWFFRNPEREPEDRDPSSVISSADGTVLKVERLTDSRYGGDCEKISIFMSPLNVHVNRAPVSGVVEKVEYIPGKFFAANLDKASTDNERNFILMKSTTGQKVGFIQIAGFIARRIVSHAKPGDNLSVGQRYGLIRFGSRMEIFLPVGTQILVQPGQTISAGQTVVAKLQKSGG